jgi:hypothetical protein
MKLDINTTEKTIKILEDISAKELLTLAESIKNIDEYRILQTKEFVYQSPITYHYQNYPYVPTIPCFTTSGTGITTLSHNSD